MKKRLIAALARTARADCAYLDHQIDGKTWVASRLQLNPVINDLAKPIC